MCEFQKPIHQKSATITTVVFFHPYPSCEGCVQSWRTKDTSPCNNCRRDPDYLHCIVDRGTERQDFYITQKNLILKVNNQKNTELEEGFYYLKKRDNSLPPVLVQLYHCTDLGGKLVLGFNTHDGGGLLCVDALTDNSYLVPVIIIPEDF